MAVKTIEIREETGYVVEPVSLFLTMNEYYEEYKYVSHYFLCEIIGKTEQNLTAFEMERGLIPEWIAPERMLKIYSKHNDFAAANEEKRGAYLREYTAITEYFEMLKMKRLEVISFFESDRQEHWLKEIAKCDWGAGVFLHELLSKGTFFDAVGEGSRVLLLTDGDELISFCTYAQKDDIQPTCLTPWMGFVYTFPRHRGHHYVGLLFAEVERLAKQEHVSNVYISTGHIGLYEKYGCEYFTRMNDMNGEASRVYVKRIR